MTQLIKLKFYSIWLDFIRGENNKPIERWIDPDKPLNKQAAIKFIAVVDCWLVLIRLCENFPGQRQYNTRQWL